MIGELKFFDVRKRFGIIIPDGVSHRDKDKQVFFYEDVLQESAEKLQAGQRIEYTLNPNTKDPRALTVKCLGKVVSLPRKEAYGD